MKLTGISLTALVLVLTAPAFAQTACETGFVVGTDGDCEAVPVETTTTMETVPDADNPGETIEVEVVETTVDEGDPGDDPMAPVVAVTQ